MRDATVACTVHISSAKVYMLGLSEKKKYKGIEEKASMTKTPNMPRRKHERCPRDTRRYSAVMRSRRQAVDNVVQTDATQMQFRDVYAQSRTTTMSPGVGRLILRRFSTNSKLSSSSPQTASESPRSRFIFRQSSCCACA
jgi:hypothetical protein